ncbi:MAG: menaquinone biosynthetic enzyme MqnA/MqnD family protein [Phycisphaerales bacterium]
MKTETRIGCVNFLNTAPLIEGLGSLAGVTVTGAVPSKLVGLLERDEADVALVSLIDAARSAVPLVVVPAGMIGCDGPTLTVRLYSQVPIDGVRVVHADTDSHTSVALCRLLLKDRYGIEPSFADYDARERMPLARRADAEPSGEEADGSSWPESMLLIGDKVVTDSPPAVRYPHQCDLGELWREQTGLPFVYAVWMCRGDRVDDARVRRAAALLDRQRRHNRTRIDHIVTNRAPEHRWPADLARRYIGRCLRYDFDERAREAAGLFLERCVAAGLAPHARLTVADQLIGPVPA